MEKRKTEISNTQGVIDERKLLRILGVVDISPRVKARSNPVEPIVTLSSAGKDLDELVEALKEHAGLMKKYSVKLYYIFVLQLNSGARISEVLGIKPNDIMANGNVRLRGKKGSDNRIITGGEATEYLLKCRSTLTYPFSDYNRKFIWSIYKKFGIEIEVNTSGKKAVTHSLRHIMVNSARQIGIENKETAKYIGHKNESNTKNYGNTKKENRAT